jgi:hypothetical protein
VNMGRGLPRTRNVLFYGHADGGALHRAAVAFMLTSGRLSLDSPWRQRFATAREAVLQHCEPGSARQVDGMLRCGCAATVTEGDVLGLASPSGEVSPSVVGACAHLVLEFMDVASPGGLKAALVDREWVEGKGCVPQVQEALLGGSTFVIATVAGGVHPLRLYWAEVSPSGKVQLTVCMQRSSAAADCDGWEDGDVAQHNATLWAANVLAAHGYCLTSVTCELVLRDGDACDGTFVLRQLVALGRGHAYARVAAVPDQDFRAYLVWLVLMDACKGAVCGPC